MNPWKKIGFFAVKILICIIAFKIMKNNIIVKVEHSFANSKNFHSDFTVCVK